jgi:hypothetical protein
MIAPVVREMLLCEDVRARSAGKIDVFGLLNNAATASVPMTLSFSVYLCLTEVRGEGTGQIVVTQADSEEDIYVGNLHPFQPGSGVTELVPYVIRIPACQFPSTGLYWVRFVYNEVVLDERPLVVRESP